MRIQPLRLMVMIILSPLLGGSAADAAARKAHPGEVANLVASFCALQANDSLALPPAYLFSRELRRAVADGLKARRRDERRHPDEKPVLGDGIPYRSYPDAPTRCLAGRTVSRAPLVVEVRYALPGQGGWRDRLLLRRVGGRLRIDDVLYATEKHQRGLRAALLEAIR